MRNTYNAHAAAAKTTESAIAIELTKETEVKDPAPVL